MDNILESLSNYLFQNSVKDKGENCSKDAAHPLMSEADKVGAEIEINNCLKLITEEIECSKNPTTVPHFREHVGNDNYILDVVISAINRIDADVDVLLFYKVVISAAVIAIETYRSELFRIKAKKIEDANSTIDKIKKILSPINNKSCSEQQIHVKNVLFSYVECYVNKKNEINAEFDKINCTCAKFLDKLNKMNDVISTPAMQKMMQNINTDPLDTAVENLKSSISALTDVMVATHLANQTDQTIIKDVKIKIKDKLQSSVAAIINEEFNKSLEKHCIVGSLVAELRNVAL